ncbi:MAG TPA: hypothetical protein PKJ56_12760 [Promineifilum sp.]|nr:hypothetical protein [Promineifilum sp.]
MPRSAPSLQQVVPALLAGLLIGVLEVALATSHATLLFNDDMSVFLSRGVGMTLFASAVGIAINTLLTSHPAIIGGNQDAPAAIMGVMAAAITALAAPLEVRLATLLVAVPAGRGAYQHSEDIAKLIPHLGQNVIVNLLTPLLVAVGLFLAS